MNSLENRPFQPHLMRLRQFIFTLCVLVALISGFAHASYAQTPPPAPPAQGQLTPNEAHYLLDTLNNPQKRDVFTHNLTLMAKGLPAPTAPPPAPAADNSFHFDVDQLGDALSHHVDNFTSLFKNLKFVGFWFKNMMQDPQARIVFFTALADAIIIVVLAMIAERLTSVALRKPLALVTKRADQKQSLQVDAQKKDQQETARDDGQDASAVGKQTDQKKSYEVLRYLARVPYNAMHFVIKLCPVIVFWGSSSLVAELCLPNGSVEHNVAFLFISTYSISRTVYLIVETTLAPHSPIIRLVPVKNDTALMLTRWWMLFVTTPAIIVCMSVLGQQFHLVNRGIIALLRAVVLIQHLIVAAFIWRVRKLVAHALQPIPSKRHTAIGAFLATLAHIWWIPVMFIDMALWFVWAAHLKNGYHHILFGTVLTFLFLFVARITALLVFGLENRIFTISPSMQARFPELQKRANLYYPYAHRITSFFIILFTAIFIIQSWGIPSLSFFFVFPFGRHIIGALFCFLIGTTIAVVFWELVTELVHRRITYYTQQGRFSRASRLKTILPIMQTVLMVLIIVLVGVTTLAQLGINVTPLLTGAGILGVGLSFGSQSLVKDVITGFFMLAEDSIHVGDWVSTGNISGKVEHLSIRTLRLRSINGDLHIIPFSSVASIANTARGFNQIIINMELNPDEDTRRQAVKIMEDTVEKMRHEDAYRDKILSGYIDKGVDSSNGGAATTVGIIQTAPMMKWEVQREFYRRIGPIMAKEKVGFYDTTNLGTTPANAPIHVALDNFPTTQHGEVTSPQNAPAHKEEASGKDHPSMSPSSSTKET